MSTHLSLLILSTLFFGYSETSEKGTKDYLRCKTIVNSDSNLQTGWYYVVDTNNGFKYQLERDSLFYYIDPNPIVTSKNIVKYKIYKNYYGDLGLAMQLDDDGTAAWSEATEKSIDKYLAFIVDNKLMQVAMVNSKIEVGMTALNRGIYTKGELKKIKKLIMN